MVFLTPIPLFLRLTGGKINDLDAIEIAGKGPAALDESLAGGIESKT